jgi:signal transduction histidine kinase
VKRHLVFFYWLLLLVSTLAIGGVAFYTLQRESDRLRKIASQQAVQTGVGIVAGLSANVNRTMMETMDALASFSEDNLEAQLLNWKGNNLLASHVLLFDSDGGLILPLSHTRERDNLEPFLHNGPVWLWDDADTRQPQQQTIITLQRSTTVPTNPAANNSSLQLPEGVQGNQSQTMSVPEISGLSSDVIITSAESSVVVNSGISATQAQSIIHVLTNEIVSSLPERRWESIGTPANQRWLGWARAVPGGAIRGVVLNWAELEKAMPDSFPPQLDAATGFVLLNPAGQPVISRFPNATTRDPPADGAADPSFPYHAIKTLPVGDLMPGWKLQVYFNPNASFTSSFIAVSTILVSILVMTVLVGGTLLMREARREASEAARKTSFVSNVSHELKTPLTTIRMYAELLGEGRVRDQLKQNNYLATIIAESQRLTRLVNNVLDFSRLEQGRKQYHPADVALPAVIDAVLNAQKPRLDEAGFTIGCSFPAGPAVRVHADRDALEQVFLNLIDNALKYAAPGRWIGIHVSTDADFAYVAVSDRGPGVPLDHRERIFETFHRVDDSITASQPGAGLGLSIARRLLRDQEGDLTYESHEPHGASFIAKLPLAAAISTEKIA